MDDEVARWRQHAAGEGRRRPGRGVDDPRRVVALDDELLDHGGRRERRRGRGRRDGAAGRGSKDQDEREGGDRSSLHAPRTTAGPGGSRQRPMSPMASQTGTAAATASRRTTVNAAPTCVPWRSSNASPSVASRAMRYSRPWYGSTQMLALTSTTKPRTHGEIPSA